jgi:hypothetical protein
MLKISFPENSAVCERMWQNTVEPERPQMTIYEGESNENLKSAIKIRNTARLSCTLITVILQV